MNKDDTNIPLSTMYEKNKYIRFSELWLGKSISIGYNDTLQE